MSKFIKRKRITLYQNKWVTLHLDDVEFPNGRIIKEHHLIDFDYPSVGVVLLNEKNEILLIRSLRYTTDSFEWEIPAGGVEKEESLTDAVRRETLEETGYSITNIHLLSEEYPLISISNKKEYIFIATATTESEPLTPEEVIEQRWFSQNDLRNMILNNEIRDGMTLIGALYLLANIGVNYDSKY